MCSYTKAYRYVVQLIHKFYDYIEAKIFTPSNTTTIKNIPVTINCTVTTNINSNYYKLLWVEKDSFVQSDNHYTTWSTQSDDGMVTHHHLTIHRVVSTAAYTCKLINAQGTTIDSKTQHVIVSEGEFFVISLVVLSF